MESGGVRLTFLGTGGANSIRRSCAGIAVQLPSGATVLLDTCGGNEVLRQLAAAGIAPDTIRAVVVTHQHFDHAAGLPPLLLQFVRHDHPVDIYCPHVAVPLLRTVLEVLCPKAMQRMGGRLRWHGCSTGDSASVGDEARLSFFEVAHVVEAIGVAVEIGGRRLVYSGDTGPSDTLVSAARGAALLIHESTGLASAGETERQRAAGHSTAGDAGRAAQAAGVQRLILTHVGDASDERCARLVAEAGTEYAGPLHVASDLEVVHL